MTESGERERFEKWANAKGAHVEQTWNGEFYDNKLVESAWQGWQAAFEAGRGGLPVRKANDPILDVEIYLERDELLTLIDACDIYVFSDKLNDVRSQLHRQLPAPPDSGDAKKAKE